MIDYSLIADSGIQFITVDIDLRSIKLPRIVCKMGTKRVEEDGNKYATPLIVEFDSEIEDYIDIETGERVDSGSFDMIKASQALSLYQGLWIPIPYFIEEQYETENSYIGGPIGWCRAMIQKSEASADSYVLILAFDTYLDKDSTSKYNRVKHMTLTGNNVKTGVARASLVEDIKKNSALLEEDWLHEYTQGILKNGAKVAGISNILIENNYFYYFGVYLVFLKFLKKFAPTVTIYEPLENQKIDVDFVLDIGNSRSCGVLIESTKQKFHNFDFTNATTFHLRDLQRPHITYSDPFEMKIEFVKAEFGKIEMDSWDRAFYWPSVVRVGKEAIDRVFAIGKLDVPTGMSSPKRYLWDVEPRKVSWHFNSGNINEELKPVGSGRSILSELPIDVEGNLSEATKMELKGRYSRKAMMTFTLIEIFLQAISYINNYKFREKNGNPKYQRVLKRVVLTTPTAMLNTDKKTFRECANSAIEILRAFYNKNGDSSIFDSVEIVPSADDIIVNPEQASQIIDRKEWGFDEATCVQLAFMYGEITNKYQNNSQLFFDIEGKKRRFEDKNGREVVTKGVTVASLDIGGGTTDLMVCNYINESEGNTTVIVPYPEFYDGFNIAGDDILKRVIERLVIRAIERYSNERGCTDTQGVINFLFGEYTAYHTSSDKEYKKNITTQFLIPVALYALEIASKDEEILETKNFNEIIDELRRGDRIRKNILDYVNELFIQKGARDFQLDKVLFTFSTKEINEIISQVMSPIINKLSMIIKQLECDYLIIAGQPSKLKVIRELINKYLPITPDRVVLMGNYYIGKWYPFAKANGLIDDPKTTVAVGATVALMSGTVVKLDGFRTDTYYLKEKVKSTARYIGEFDTKNRFINSVIFKPDDDGDNSILYNGATYFGMKQLDVENWPGNCMYRVDFKDDEVAKKLSKRLPLTIDMTRAPQNPEILLKTMIVDKNGNPVKLSSITLTPQTLGNEDGYWLDTGIFHTSIY